MRYISLFSGIEAATVAWEPLGWEPVAFAEIDRFCCELLAAKYPTVPNLGDVSEIDWTPYHGTVDVVVGGSPCQAFSMAGKRGGLMDERGRLMLEFVRAVRDIQPRWMLWENVPGVLSQSDGDAFETLQRELEQCGYSLAWRTLDAQFFGVAQRRRRVFLVGHASAGCAAAVLFERESLRRNPTTSKRKREELTGEARRGYEESYTLVERSNRDRKRGGSGPLVDEGLSYTITTSNNQTIFQRVTDYCVQGNIARGARFGQWGDGWSDDGASYTLNTMDNHAVCDTCGYDGYVVRRLTPTEYERLQGFPDGYTLIRDDISDAKRYKALGNSMAVPVMRWIGERIDMVDEIVKQ